MYGLIEPSRWRQRAGQTRRCPLASYCGTEGVWESGTSWQRAQHQCTPEEKETHSVRTSRSIVFHLPSPFHPLCSGVTGHEWGVSPSRICSLAPCSGSSQAESVLLGAARSCKERWMSRWALACDVSPLIDDLTLKVQLHRSDGCTLTIRPPDCSRQAAR